tara:strand:- start:668 stop:994 length:327 start_codon:yes stop_codon:yes gene_type:complete
MAAHPISNQKEMPVVSPAFLIFTDTNRDRIFVIPAPKANITLRCELNRMFPTHSTTSQTPETLYHYLIPFQYLGESGSETPENTAGKPAFVNENQVSADLARLVFSSF